MAARMTRKQAAVGRALTERGRRLMDELGVALVRGDQWEQRALRAEKRAERWKEAARAYRQLIPFVRGVLINRGSLSTWTAIRWVIAGGKVRR